MNERIKELEKQCWSHRVDGALVDGQLHFDTEKFAELIVADCVKIIEGYFDESPEIMGLPLDILEHFDMEMPDNDWNAEEELQKIVDEYDMSELKKDLDPNLVWESTLDKIYHCTVTRTDEYKGILKVTNTENLFVLLEQEVTLMYGARFGPDVDDVLQWQEMIMQAVDSQ